MLDMTKMTKESASEINLREIAYRFSKGLK